MTSMQIGIVMGAAMAVAGSAYAGGGPMPFPTEHAQRRNSALKVGGGAVDRRIDGVTVEVGLGVGWVRMREELADPEGQRSVSPSLSVGIWRGSDAASVRIASGVFHRVMRSGERPTTTGVFVGPTVQRWFGRRVGFVGGGVGLLAFIDADGWSRAPACDLRTGVAIVRFRSAALLASVEGTLGITDTGPATHVALQLGLQHW